MKLIVASNNSHKIREIKEILGTQFDCVLSLLEAGVSVDVEETGTTYAENALLKAREIRRVLKEMGQDAAVLSDDSGIEVDALNGEPGVYSARYSGEGDEGNNQKLLKELASAKERTARYRCVVVYIDSAKELIGEGACEGEILYSYRGEGGFGYDPLFFSNELQKTFAECSEDEKNTVSHRKRALENLLKQM